MRILGEVRARFGFLLVGYVIMPEHLHLLISESGSAYPATVVQVFKQRVSRRLRGKKRSAGKQLSLRFPQDGAELRRFWQRRYHDFNVYNKAKLQEKLYYIHANPVRAKLVKHPGDWPWSSWCYYYRGAGCGRWMRGYGGKSKSRMDLDCKERRAAHPLPKPQREGHPGNF